MKRLLFFFLLACSLLAFVSCGYKTDDPTFLSQSDYDEKILEPELTDDQSMHLSEISYYYGIDLRMNQYWDENEYFYYSGEITPEEYGDVIDCIYFALTRIADEYDSNTHLIGDCIDTISCISNMEFDGVQYDFCASTEQSYHKNFYFSYNSDSDPKELAAEIMYYVALYLPCMDVNDEDLCLFDIDSTSNKTALVNLTNYGFCANQYNGFSNYDNNVTYDNQKYVNILKENGITDTHDILVECACAGLLSPSSSESVICDFADYIFAMTRPSGEIWKLYPVVEPVQIKADAAITYISSINPSWNKGFFISMSNPDNLPELYEPKSFGENLSRYCSGAVYTGIYQNSRGEMNAVLEITSFDSDTGEITAEFTFSPAPNSPEENSGKYRMTGSYDYHTNSISLKGAEWISIQPSGYNMLDIDGVMFATRIVGEFNRDELTEINLVREDINELPETIFN
jgi:hypothetical protein